MNNHNPYNNPLQFKPGKAVERRTGFKYRYPRIFVGVCTTVPLLILFSKPIYDLFFSTEQFDLEQLARERQARFSK